MKGEHFIMGNVISYIDEFGGYTFVEKPMCELDGLILSHLSYYVYDGIVPTLEEAPASIKLEDLGRDIDKENFISVKWELEKNRELFEKVTSSRRYRSARACFYVHEIDNDSAVQFGAVTFVLGNGDVFVSFRGTDDELVGWKEDFYMACRAPVGAQIRSAEYINRIAEHFIKRKNLRLYLGGHSKGGNLAVYAAMCCDDHVKRKIARIYDMDGPGFHPEFMKHLDYDRIKDKIFKIVPDGSFVGLLMETRTDYTLIKSTQIGLSQHVTLSWCVEGDSFVRSNAADPSRKALYDKINQWIYDMSREQVDNFTENLFKLIEITEASTLTDLKTVMPDAPKKLHNIGIEYRKMDEKTKRIFWEISVFIMEVAAQDQQDRIKKSKTLEKIRQHIEA